MRDLIPRPSALRWGQGDLVIDETATLSGPREVVRLWRATLSVATGFELAPAAEGATIQLVLDGVAELGAEGYRLSVGTDRVLVVAATSAGLVNALQTVLQLLPPAIYSRGPVRGLRWALPCAEIEDVPRFRWRGAMLDAARHFLPASFLFRFVDLLAMHKLNVLHLHLTDDQGWRFPSAAYPLLTETGGWRRETLIGHGGTRRTDPHYDGTPHGGHYTRRELRDLVAYAAERNVTVVPEIDLPGHTQAAIAAYPELGNTDQRLEVMTGWGVSPHVLNLSEPTMGFCREIIAELADIFPSPFIHGGGDECPRTEWEHSAAAAERIAALGLSVDTFQHWFTQRLNDELHHHGRRLVAWDEILEGGQPPAGAVVMSWRGTTGGVAAAKAGFDTVISPESAVYLDHYQSQDPDEPLAIGGLTTLRTVYEFDPIAADMPADAAGHVLGTEFMLWSEYLPSADAVEYMAFPRGCALAEVAWSTANRDFGEFTPRLEGHLERLEMLSVNYRPLDGPHPWQRGGTGPRRRP